MLSIQIKVLSIKELSFFLLFLVFLTQIFDELFFFCVLVNISLQITFFLFNVEYYTEIIDLFHASIMYLLDIYVLDSILCFFK